MRPNLFADVTLYPTDRGGRAGSTPSNWFGCLCTKDQHARENWDCRLLLDGAPLAPGESRRVGIVFLSGQEAANDLRKTGKFFLRDGRIIGEAVIVD